MYIMSGCKYETCFECNLLILLSIDSTCKIKYLSREIDRGYHVMSEAVRTLTVVHKLGIDKCRRIAVGSGGSIDVPRTSRRIDIHRVSRRIPKACLWSARSCSAEKITSGLCP